MQTADEFTLLRPKNHHIYIKIDGLVEWKGRGISCLRQNL
jgi:hypothetical protein